MANYLPVNLRIILSLTLLCFVSNTCSAASAQENSSIAGSWIFNQKLSDNTDKQIEVAIKASGGKVKKRWWFSNEKEIYRGGPAEQELYDRISYDNALTIKLIEPEFTFTYDDNYVRPVFTDNRNRSVSLNRLAELEDFSLGYWENSTLLVEAHPRDGGFTNETYRLINKGKQLQVDIFVRTPSFQVPIEIKRVYDRAD